MTWDGGDAARHAVRALRDRVDVIVAGGGDGTVNEIVNGLFRETDSPDAAMAVVPLGSANDFAPRTTSVRSLFERRSSSFTPLPNYRSPSMPNICSVNRLCGRGNYCAEEDSAACHLCHSCLGILG